MGDLPAGDEGVSLKLRVQVEKRSRPVAASAATTLDYLLHANVRHLQHDLRPIDRLR
jgi:hypothetical protein